MNIESKIGCQESAEFASDMASTMSHGTLNEVYYLREDLTAIRDLGLIISDGSDFFSEEKRNTTHNLKLMKDGVPAYKIINTCVQKKYKITKEFITDPLRDTLLQKISFQPTDNKASYRLYALLAPHLNNEGDNNTG